MTAKTSRRLGGAFVCSALLFVGLLVLPAAPAAAQVLSYGPADPADPVYRSVPDSLIEGADEAPTPAVRRQVVGYAGGESAGTIIIDPANTSLYLTLGGGRALRYAIGVGRQGFEWSGIETISRKAEWPDWIPPAAMVARQPYLPRWIGGGPGNPLGARALYLGHTDYRIHGTNDPSSIGKHVSSGCIRMVNDDVIDLYNRVAIGTKAIVLPDRRQRQISSALSALPPRSARQAVVPVPRFAPRQNDPTSGIY